MSQFNTTTTTTNSRNQQFVYEAPINDHYMDDFDRFVPPHPMSSGASVIVPSTEEDTDHSLDRSSDSRSVRRILTSPSALYHLPNNHYQSSVNTSMMNPSHKVHHAVYAQPVNAPMQQWSEPGYDPYYHQPINQPINHPGMIRAGMSSTSLSTLSPSSSASSINSMPPSVQQSINQSMNHVMNQSPYMLDPGMRRIKSSPHMSINSTMTQPISQPLSGMKRKSSDANSSSISSSLSSAAKTPQSKAARRLARKAEAARASRRKKKQYINNLEDRVTKLTARLEAVQASNQAAGQVNSPANAAKLGSSHIDAVHREEQQSIKEKMFALLTEIKSESAGAINPASQPSVNQSSSVSENSSDSNVDVSKFDDLKGLVEMYISTSHKRGASMDVYLSLLSRALLPSLPLKFVLWGLSQGDEFYRMDGLWSSVMGREVGLSEEQMSKLMGQREHVTRVIAQLNDVLTQINTLRSSMKQHLEDRQRVLDDATAALTPAQIANFCLWVQQNPMCMQMIESVWQQPPMAQKLP